MSEKNHHYVLSIKVRLPRGIKPSEARRLLRRSLNTSPEGIIRTAVGDAILEDTWLKGDDTKTTKT